MTRYAQNGGLTRFDEGKSHQENPLGGIPIGGNNSVEENETKSGNFIYSDRIFLDENTVSQYNLPKSLVGKSVAGATKFIDNKFKGRNDKISQSTKNGMLSKIAEAQEVMKPQEPEMEQDYPQERTEQFQMAYGGNINRYENGQQLGDTFVNTAATGADMIIPGSGQLLKMGDQLGQSIGNSIGGNRGESIGGLISPMGTLRGLGSALKTGNINDIPGIGIFGGKTSKQKLDIENANNLTLASNKKFSDQYALGGEIDPINPPATRQDSIALKEDSLRMLTEYQKRGYKPTNVNFPNTDLNQSFLDIQKRQTIPGRKGTTEVIRNGVRKAEKFNPLDYRQNINENQFRQREAANGVLNMDIVPALYDKRVQPTSYLKLMGEGAGVQNDGVNVPYYGDMKISPENPVVKQPVINSFTPKPVVKQNTSVPQPTYTPKPVVRTNKYREQPQQMMRDNTRVGTSFTTIDPRILRKSSNVQLGYGGKMNQMGDGGTITGYGTDGKWIKPPTADYDTDVLKNFHNEIGITPDIPGYGKLIGKGSALAYNNWAQKNYPDHYRTDNSLLTNFYGSEKSPSYTGEMYSKYLRNSNSEEGLAVKKALNLTPEGYKFTPETPIFPQKTDPIITPTQTQAGFEAYADAKQVEDAKKNRSFAGKALSYTNDNLGNIARYAPIAANAYQLAKLKKPQGERLDRLSNRYKPEYVDEAQLQNIANQTMNNTVNAISQSGASQGQTRASILGSQLERTKALSDAYSQAAAQNRQQNAMAQEFNLGVDQVNLQQSNSEKDINARNKGAYDTEKSKLISKIGENIGNVGTEQAYKKIAITTTGYNWLAEYQKANPTATAEEAVTAAKKAGVIADDNKTAKKNALGGYLIKNKVK